MTSKALSNTDTSKEDAALPSQTLNTNTIGYQDDINPMDLAINAIDCWSAKTSTKSQLKITSSLVNQLTRFIKKKQQEQVVVVLIKE